MAKTDRQIHNIPLNRAQGDLELRLEFDGRTTTDAWSRGTMYRGFENILKGRGARDGLVITPRVCGICGTAHLMAAAQALDMLCGIGIPDNALLVRNLTLMTELVQSDIRQTNLMFMKDFVNPVYRDKSFYSEAMSRYKPFAGDSVVATIKETKKILEIVAIVGGQWPNSSFMVPGGIATSPTFSDIINCKYILKTFTDWYEKQILGCSVERWNAIGCNAELKEWLEENDSHRKGDLGFFIIAALQAGLDSIGCGHRKFISGGLPPLPNIQAGIASSTQQQLPGFMSEGIYADFFQARITEHIAFSRFEGYTNGLHPFEGVTEPCKSGPSLDKYSWAKAPRYDDMPAETGPLAELLIAGDPLFTDLVRDNGPSAFSRQLARIARPAKLLPIMGEILQAIDPKAPYYTPVKSIPDGRGYGIIEAARGILGHWLEIQNGIIKKYQIITPTSWNGSPRDTYGVRGPWEEATIGIEVKDPENPVEIGHIVRSFDPCQVCAVHRCNKK